MSFFELGYIGLFLACFLSATIIPFASEGVLLVFVVSGYNPFTCLMMATAGNSMGSVSNYAIGLIAKPEKIRARFKKSDAFERFGQAIQRHGIWLSLLCWLPILGDPLAVMLGFFRVSFFPFLILMTLSKFLRYFIILYFLW